MPTAWSTTPRRSTADLEILGLPRALLRVSADAPRANWFARISDVAPDGTVTQVAGAGFNGNHRSSARAPELLDAGRGSFRSTSRCTSRRGCSRKGHRIRVAVNNAQWPMLWPSPHPMTTTLAIGGADGARVHPAGRAEIDPPCPGVPAAGGESGNCPASSRSTTARPRATARFPRCGATRRRARSPPSRPTRQRTPSLGHRALRRSGSSTARRTRTPKTRR